MTRAKRLLFHLVLFACLAAVLEGASWGGLLLLQSRYLVHRVPKRLPRHGDLTFAQVREQRDPLLGWPSPAEFGGEKRDASGSRWVPAFPDPALPECAALYGDSFTLGGEVDDEHAWGNVLSGLLGCRVANYAVGGYGTDQAYLRFRENASDDAPVVVLGHLSENILRNLTRDRDLLTAELQYALKPRFVLDAASGLRLLPIPDLDEAEYLRSVGLRSPPFAVAYESFEPGGPAGVVRAEFPFTWSLVRSSRDFRVRALLARRPEHAEFYTPDHPLHGLRITAAILQRFVEDARARDRTPLVIVFPTRDDVAWHARTGAWVYQPLLDALDAARLPVLHFGPALVAHIGARDREELFRPGGHYNDEGNRVLAQFVRDALAERAILGAGTPTRSTPAPGG
ncbi:MAG: hypothetical protein ACT4PE_02540 [Candidatus Eiseniibacteriota bacterium]